VNEETFAVHVLMAAFLHPRPLQSSEPLHIDGGGVIHSQRTDESSCAHSAGSAMAHCPAARPAWASCQVIFGCASVRECPPTDGDGVDSSRGQSHYDDAQHC